MRDLPPAATIGRHTLDDEWTVARRSNIFQQLRGSVESSEVRLPHDAVIGQRRTPSGTGGTAYFPEGIAVAYSKVIDAPAAWEGMRVALEFQGVHRDAMVFVNDEFAGQYRSGYATFHVELGDLLRPGRPNTIRVEARGHGDARWYSGVGIIRDVVLIVSGPVHLERTGPVTTLLDIDDELAVVESRSVLENHSPTTTTVRLEVRVRNAAGTVVDRTDSPVTLRAGQTQTARSRLVIRTPRRWSTDDPHLYTVEATVRDGDDVLDRRDQPLGLRTIRLDPEHGLRINGETVKLRGACVHHDNGILGAATIRRADERRVELLKQAGFNALRSAHNPMSEAMLDACDRLGVLVIDEAFDVWTEGKRDFDHSLDFPEWWERDIESMVRKDLPHPSVIGYSIGNEIVETGSAVGSIWGRRLAEKVRELDGTRFVTNGINPFVSLLRQLPEEIVAGAGGINDVMGTNLVATDRITASELATRQTEESYAVLDVAGINYGETRYEMDQQLFPHRLIVGTESFALRIPQIWELVTRLPHVLGDFTWTGYDYLGEVGVGRVKFADDSVKGFEAPFPWIAAWCADIDLTGHRRPQSYLRETVFGLRHEPYIAVERPNSTARGAHVRQWSWFDGVSTWTWDVPTGTPLRLEVYSDADEIELLLDGTSIGTAPVGAAAGYTARFEVPYAPGTVTAIARSGGVETARSALTTATAGRRLRATPDRAVLEDSPGELCFVTIEITDDDGIPTPGSDRPVSIAVSGAGELQGLGSARPDPDPDESYRSTWCRTFDGRALAAIRPTGPGEIVVDVTAEGLDPQQLRLTVEAAHLR